MNVIVMAYFFVFLDIILKIKWSSKKCRYLILLYNTKHGSILYGLADYRIIHSNVLPILKSSFRKTT